jgi:hypothetical protein
VLAVLKLFIYRGREIQQRGCGSRKNKQPLNPAEELAFLRMNAAFRQEMQGHAV